MLTEIVQNSIIALTSSFTITPPCQCGIICTDLIATEHQKSDFVRNSASLLCWDCHLSSGTYLQHKFCTSELRLQIDLHNFWGKSSSKEYSLLCFACSQRPFKHLHERPVDVRGPQVQANSLYPTEESTSTIITNIKWYNSLSSLLFIPQDHHGHLVLSVSLFLSFPLILNHFFVTSLSHYILSISCAASLLSCVHLLLFTGVFISQSLPPPGYPFLFSTKNPSIYLVSCEIHLLLSVYHPAIIL